MNTSMPHIEFVNATHNADAMETWAKEFTPAQMLRLHKDALSELYRGVTAIVYYRCLGNWTLLNGQWIKRQ